MQKVINVLAVLSFLGTAGIIGGGTGCLSGAVMPSLNELKKTLPRQQQKQLQKHFQE